MSKADIPFPSHAYVPGQTPRHPDDWFDPLKSDVGLHEDVTCSTAWRAGQVYLEHGYFWECHEVLEAVWLHLPNPSPERDMTQAIIQLANARLKTRMGKPRATKRLAGMVLTLLAPHEGEILGCSVDKLRATAAGLL